MTVTFAELSVTGSDPTGQNEPISYNWTITSAPQGANVQLNGAAPSATNAITTITNLMQATFSQAGAYIFQVIAIDASGLSDPSDVIVTVEQVATSVTVNSANSAVFNGQTDTLTGSLLDQFGNPMSLAGASWSVQSGGIGGGVSYLLTDGHGSTRALLSSTGSITSNSGNFFNYDAFGNAIGRWSPASAGTVFLFGGDAVYDPVSGLYMNGDGTRDRLGFEFIQMDPTSGSNQDPISLHKYLYAEADPINGNDPTGNDDNEDDDPNGEYAGYFGGLLGAIAAQQSAISDLATDIGNNASNAIITAATLAATTVPVIAAGYDITIHLLLIQKDLTNQYAHLSAAQQAALGKAFDSSIVNQQGNWDITDLKGDLHKSGLLNGVYTCTVNGTVYADDQVNYWLYGIWARLLGRSAAWCESKIAAHAATSGYPSRGRIAWFSAGYSGAFAQAVSAAIPGATPATPPSMGGADYGPLTWYVGNGIMSLRGSD